MKPARLRLFESVALLAGFLATCGPAPAARAEDATPGFKGDGLCRFALHHYVLPKANEDKINYIVGDLLRRHEEAFHFTASTNMHVRIHIFGTFEGFRDFAEKSRSGFGRETPALSQIAGFFMEPEDEVVTWRQSDPTRLANNILHECSHAIMHQQFRTLPIWLDEGCAVYFSYPTYMRDEHDELALRSRWYELAVRLRDGSLPDLRQFLDISRPAFQIGDPAKMYPFSWSIFQLLMSSPEKRQAMNEMILAYQKPGVPPDCAELLNRFYPGGLAQMGQDWRVWIARGAASLLGSQ